MESGEKFCLNLGNVEGEILGVYPAGQTVPMTIKDGAYQIFVEGFKGIISKQLFDVIFKSGSVPIVEAVVIPVKKVHKKGVK